MLADYDGGLHMLNNLGFYPYPALQIDPILDSLRDNPEFQRIMQKARRQHEAFKAKHF